MVIGLALYPATSYATGDQTRNDLEELTQMALHCGRKYDPLLVLDHHKVYRVVDIYTLENIGISQFNFIDGKESDRNGKVDPSDYVSIIGRGRVYGDLLKSPVWDNLPPFYQRLIKDTKENMSKKCSPEFKCC